MLSNGAAVSGGKDFMRAAQTGGKWAAERMLRAIKEGRELNPKELRDLDTLPYESWVAFDDVAIREAMIRAPLASELLAAGLRIPITGAMGKTMFQFDKITDMEAAIISLDGLARSDDDRIELSQGNVPLPIIHKDFNIGLRSLSASRSGGEPLDTTQGAVAGRKVGEQLDNITINGGPTFGSATVYGLRTHPDRITGGFGTNGNWSQLAKTGADIFRDVSNMAAALRLAGFPGPYWLVIPPGYPEVIDADYKANGDRTIRERVMLVEGLSRIVTDDQMPANNIVMFQATRDVVAIADGEPVQTVQWDTYGGFQVAFKVFCIQVPIIRSTESGASGVYHMS